MKTFKKLGSAVVLTFVLTIPALAGDIEIPGSTPPPPPNSAMTQGDIQIPGASADESASSVTVIDAAVSLLVDVLSF